MVVRISGVKIVPERASIITVRTLASPKFCRKRLCTAMKRLPCGRRSPYRKSSRRRSAKTAKTSVTARTSATTRRLWATSQVPRRDMSPASSHTRSAQGTRATVSNDAARSAGQRRVPSAVSSGRPRPALGDARLRPRPAFLQGNEEERDLAVQGELPAPGGANILVFVVAGRNERLAGEVAGGVEARSPARTVVPVEHDRQVVDEVHAALEALPETTQVGGHLLRSPVRARPVRAVVPHDPGVAQLQERLHVRFCVAGVATILDEAVLVV